MSDSEKAIEKGCICGGRYRLLGRSIAYSPEDDCMVDVYQNECLQCGHPRQVKVPLKGPTYDGMVKFFREQAKQGG